MEIRIYIDKEDCVQAVFTKFFRILGMDVFREGVFPNDNPGKEVQQDDSVKECNNPSHSRFLREFCV